MTVCVCKLVTFSAFLWCREDWYSLLYSSSEGKNSKRANLVLSVLHPGSHIPWLGPFSHLGLATAAEQTGGFPVGPPHSLSYQNPSCLIWAGDSTLQVCEWGMTFMILCVGYMTRTTVWAAVHLYGNVVVAWCGGCSHYREVHISAASCLPSTERLEQVSAIHAQITRERNHIPQGGFLALATETLR